MRVKVRFQSVFSSQREPLFYCVTGEFIDLKNNNVRLKPDKSDCVMGYDVLQDEDIVGLEFER